MGQTTDQIENHIENKREDLKSNLDELETRVKSATDWRHQFQEHTGMMIAVAFGGGLLLSSMVGRRRGSAAPSASASAMPSGFARSSTPGTKHEVLETWDTVKSALVGVAATRFKGMLGEIVPGFSDHLTKVERNRRVTGKPNPAETPIEH